MNSNTFKEKVGFSSFMKIFEKFDKDSAFLLNENLKLKTFKNYMEFIIESPQKKITRANEDKEIHEEFDKFAKIDYKKIFLNQPTQIRSLNEPVNPKKKVNLPSGKTEKDFQYLNKKRKQPDGLNDLKKDLIEKYLNFTLYLINFIYF